MNFNRLLLYRIALFTATHLYLMSVPLHAAESALKKHSAFPAIDQCIVLANQSKINEASVAFNTFCDTIIEKTFKLAWLPTSITANMMHTLTQSSN
jgi:hypothetical protein